MMTRDERRQEDRDTRDIAVEARSMVNQHMTDCEKFRITVSDAFKEFREEFKKLNWRLALFLGGMMVVKEAFDWFVSNGGLHR